MERPWKKSMTSLSSLSKEGIGTFPSSSFFGLQWRFRRLKSDRLDDGALPGPRGLRSEGLADVEGAEYHRESVATHRRNPKLGPGTKM